MPLGKRKNVNKRRQGWVSRKKSNVSSEQREVANFNTAAVEFIVSKSWERQDI
jgi:hypothetical protein